MKIVVIGSGYVGLVTAACFADVGNEVVGVDISAEKIALLNNFQVPIHEPGLSPLIESAMREGRLTFTTDLPQALQDAQIAFIAVGTPPEEDGSADLSHVLSVARSLGEHLKTPLVVVDKSTVPVGTADQVRASINQALARRQIGVNVAVISNPEFLKEGAAIADFQRPDRIVLGGNLPEEQWAMEKMKQLYAPFQRNHERIMVMDTRSAELTKYAANAMLATRISFMNDLANLAEHLGADIEEVRRGIGADTRIGFDFLYAGCGYGGSCFPKDVKAILHTARTHGYPLTLMQAVEEVNNRQKHRLVEKVQEKFGKDLSPFTVAIWGLAFKANTDDIREASSLIVMEDLAKAGVRTVRVYDPEAMAQMQAHWARKPIPSLKIIYAQNPYLALEGADFLMVLTEWKVFRSPDFARVQALLKPTVIFDGRNLYDPHTMRDSGIEYHAIGRGIR